MTIEERRQNAIKISKEYAMKEKSWRWKDVYQFEAFAPFVAKEDDEGYMPELYRYQNDLWLKVGELYEYFCFSKDGQKYQQELSDMFNRPFL
jgi:hypothetical protein